MDLFEALQKACLITRDALIDAIKVAFSNEEDWWEKRVLVSLTEIYEIRDVPKTEDLSVIDLNLCYKILNYRDKNNRTNPNLKRFVEYYRLDYFDFKYLIGQLKAMRNVTSHLTQKAQLAVDVLSVSNSLYELKKLIEGFDLDRSKQILALIVNINKQPRTVEEIAMLHNISPETVMKYVYEFKQEFVDGKIMADSNFDSRLFKVLSATQEKEALTVVERPANDEFINLLDGHQVFLLSDVLMNKNSESFLQQTVIPALRKSGKQIYILESTLNMIIRFIMLKDDDGKDFKEARHIARHTYRLIEYMYSNKLCAIIGEDGDSPLEHEVLISRLSQYKAQINSPLIFTENKTVANEIDRIYSGLASIYYITDNNTYDRLNFERLPDDEDDIIEESDEIIAETDNNDGTGQLIQELPTDSGNNNSAFILYKEVTPIDKSVIPTNSVPYEGDTVYSQKFGDVLLDEEFAGGGEGILYKTNKDGYVAKIYKKDKITKDRYEKLKLMMSQDINIPQLCWPYDILTNSDGEFVGYVMKEGKGVKLYNLLVNTKILQKYFADWDRKNLVRLSITILETFNALHKKNILAGDINLYNILVESDTSVYFVDCDSYQIEQYQSTVGIEGFIAPEIYETMDKINGGNLDLNLIMRTPETESFAISALIFHILFLGQSPYASVGDQSIAESTRNRSFGYPFDERKGYNAPAGVWRFIWSNLNYQMKEMFDSVFVRGERFNDEYMISKLRGYLYDMEKRSHISHELLPQKYKETSQTEFVTLNCTMCGKEYNTDKESSEARYFDGHCPTCKRAINAAKKNMFVYNCVDCGKEVEISQWELAEKKDRGMALPTKCDHCRRFGFARSTTSSSTTSSSVAPASKQTSSNATVTQTTPTYTPSQRTVKAPKKPGLFERFKKLYGKHKFLYTLIIILAIVSKKYIDTHGMEAYKEQVKIIFDAALVILERVFKLFIRLISSIIKLLIKLITELIARIEEWANQ